MNSEHEDYIHLNDSITSLNKAWKLLVELSNTNEKTLITRAAFELAIIEYAKPFKRSRGVSGRMLSLTEPPLRRKDLELHRKLLTLRDQVLAHSDLSIKGPMLHLGSIEGQPLPIITQWNAPNLPDATTVRVLIETLLDILYNQYSEMLENLEQAP